MFLPRKVVSLPLTSALGILGLTISGRDYEEPENFEKAELLKRILPWVGDIEGDIAEAGVYRGSSAKIICDWKDGKTLHLFDTFAGLPKPCEFDSLVLKEGAFKCAVETVRSHLYGYNNVKIYQGLVSDTLGLIQDTKFSFVHLDLDLYEGTLASVRFFYDRMSPGGVILCHDYPRFKGVKKAFDEFFADCPKAILQISRNYAFILKR